MDCHVVFIPSTPRNDGSLCHRERQCGDPVLTLWLIDYKFLHNEKTSVRNDTGFHYLTKILLVLKSCKTGS